VEGRNLLAALVENALDGILAVDRDGTILTWNHGAEAILGYREDEIVGRNVDVLLAPGEVPTAIEEIARGGIVDREARCRHKDGHYVTVSATLSPVLDDDGAVVGSSAIVRDVSDRKALEEQLRQSQKMDALGQLAGSVAHDFNNLLVAIRGYGASALDRADEAAPDAASSIEKVLAAADRAAALTGRLLAFSRKRELERVPVDLNESVRETQQFVAPLLGDIELDTQLAPNAHVVADPGELSQLLVNLIVNARDAIEGPGRVTIATQELDDRVVLSVADTGAGMDEETVERIFEPFFTTKAAGEGTGLGLSTVYTVVEELGGTIDVESAVGAGTTFRIGLPAAP
jgi:two-component system, cell cycle sensor histidine kinase and response regulator CckA